MTKQTDDPLERKSITLPGSMWRSISKIRRLECIATEAETLRRVVLAGLRALDAGK